MSSGAVTTDPGVVLGSLQAAVDAFGEVDLGRLDAVELSGLLRGLEFARRRLDAVEVPLVSEIEQRCLAGDYGRTSTLDLLMEQLSLTGGEAKARVARAQDLGPRRTLSGEPLPPSFPQVAAALATGELSTGKARVITSCLHRMPPTRTVAELDADEQLLVEQAARLDARQLSQVAERLLAWADPDGAEPGDRAAQQCRALDLHVFGDGTARLSGRLTPEAAATWRPILDALSAPHPATKPAGVGEECADATHDTAGEPDDRSASQRRHDGFLEAGKLVLRANSLPDAGGAPVTILVRVDAEQLQADLRARQANGVDGPGRFVQTGTDDLLPTADLLRMAGDAEIIPVLLSDASGILSYGRTRRLASCAQRRALTARDGGCSFPGCTRPAAWTEVHHVVPWTLGGATSIENMCLLCSWHHREFQRRGWTVQMINAVPYWTPPPWLDPTQRPRRNAAHHLSEIDFHTGPPG